MLKYAKATLCIFKKNIIIVKLYNSADDLTHFYHSPNVIIEIKSG